MTYQTCYRWRRRQGRWRRLAYKKPYIDRVAIAPKFTKSLTKLCRLRELIATRPTFRLLAAIETHTGPFVAMQVSLAIWRRAQSADLLHSAMFQRLLRKRQLYPGPGTRNILGFGETSKTKGRLITNISTAEQLQCSAIFGELGHAWSPTAKKAVSLLGLAFESDGVCEESIACEISANLSRTRKRKRKNYWDETVSTTFLCAMTDLVAAQQAQIFARFKKYSKRRDGFTAM